MVNGEWVDNLVALPGRGLIFVDVSWEDCVRNIVIRQVICSLPRDRVHIRCWRKLGRWSFY